MAYFLTLEWGMDAPCGPLKFHLEKRRASAIDLIKPGDRVVYAGTQGEPTANADRGILLGMVEPTEHRVMSLDFPIPAQERDYHDGQYRSIRAAHYFQRRGSSRCDRVGFSKRLDGLCLCRSWENLTCAALLRNPSGWVIVLYADGTRNGGFSDRNLSQRSCARSRSWSSG